MSTNTTRTDSKIILKRLILLFFIVLIPLFLIYIFTFGRYQQSITVSFDEGESYIKPSKFITYEDTPLEIDGFILDISSLTYEVLEDEENSSREYNGNIKLSKTEIDPTDFSSASVSYFLKSRWTINEEYAVNNRSVSLTSSNGLAFNLNYDFELPYKYLLFPEVKHPTLFIHIRFVENNGGQFDLDTTYDYYVVYNLNPSIK